MFLQDEFEVIVTSAEKRNKGQRSGAKASDSCKQQSRAKKMQGARGCAPCREPGLDLAGGRPRASWRVECPPRQRGRPTRWRWPGAERGSAPEGLASGRGFGGEAIHREVNRFELCEPRPRARSAVEGGVRLVCAPTERSARRGAAPVPDHGCKARALPPRPGGRLSPGDREDAANVRARPQLRDRESAPKAGGAGAIPWISKSCAAVPLGPLTPTMGRLTQSTGGAVGPGSESGMLGFAAIAQRKKAPVWRRSGGGEHAGAGDSSGHGA
jgi:hypothetical protein